MHFQLDLYIIYWLKNNRMNKITYDFKNRTALVTGGAQGFGLDIVKRFLKSGAKVIIWDIDPKMLEKSIKDLNNPNLSSSIVDVSNYKEVDNKQNILVLRSNSEVLWLVGIKQSISSYVEKKDTKVLEIRFLENPI